LSKKTVEVIVASGNNFLIEVKGNQKTLKQQIRNIVTKDKYIDAWLLEEKSRGRKEHRYCEIYNSNQDISCRWKEVQRVIYVYRFGHRPDKKSNNGFYSQEHYYITDYPFDCAEKVAQGIRGHWGIENKIHYIKDTRFNEDNNGITHNNAAAILSIFQDIAINIYRCKGIQSIKTAITFFANKVKELFKFLTARHISDL